MPASRSRKARSPSNRIETKNRAESLVFQTEKTLADIGDKLSDADKADVNAAAETLKETLKGGDTEAIKRDSEALEQAFYKLSEKLYQQQGGAQGFDPNGGAYGQGGGFDPNAGGFNGGSYDADFEDKSGN